MEENNMGDWTPYTDEEGPEILSDEWQRMIANEALYDGDIALEHVAYLMATDEKYKDLLPKLYNAFQCDIHNPGKMPSVETAMDRVPVCLALLERLAFERVDGFKDGRLRERSLIPICSRDKATKKLREYDLYNDSGPAYVKIDALERYFREILGIELPNLLMAEKSEATEDTQAVEERDQGLSQDEAAKATDKSMKDLKVWLVDGYQIAFEYKGEDPIHAKWDKLGFGNSNTLTWKTLIAILKGPIKEFNLRKAYFPGAEEGRKPGTNYDLFHKIDEKLKKYIKDKFMPEMPLKYSIYKKIKYGVHSFKFEILEPSTKDGYKGLDDETWDELMQKYD